MAQALGFILNAGGGAFSVGTTISALKDKAPSTEYSTVQITVGSGAKSQADGNIPHIALWDDDGNRIGQYHPKKKDKLTAAASHAIPVEHNQNGGLDITPSYVMLSNLENDAICITSIVVSHGTISSAFYGDTGYTCGQSWFLSETHTGMEYQTPKCVWLDADHSNGINARAMSFHMNDFAPNPDKLTQYTNFTDTLCKSTPRYSFWGNLLPDGVIPFFDPKLTYNKDSTGPGQGNDTDMARVIDKPNQYNKAVYMYQGEKTKRATRRNNLVKRSNPDPGHLIITDNPGHNVQEVCESETSFGWDIVSTIQNLYCDMEAKQLYHLCDEDKVKDNCFDLEGKAIVPKGGVGARDEFAAMIPHKNYTSEAHWGH